MHVACKYVDDDYFLLMKLDAYEKDWIKDIFEMKILDRVDPNEEEIRAMEIVNALDSTNYCGCATR